MQPTNNVIVVLSGGQDSTTALFQARSQFKRVYAITFDYGQLHRIEIEAASHVAGMAGIDGHEVISCYGLLESDSPLLSARPLETYDDFQQMDRIIGDRTELTFVPMRNAMFASVAANRAVARNCQSIILGICEDDNANYPDCTENFLTATNAFVAAALGKDYSVTVEAPLLHTTKADTVRIAMGIPGCMPALAWSHTSYDGQFPPTGMNHANVLRAHGFEEVGIPDPLVLRAWSMGVMELPGSPNYDAWREIKDKLAAYHDFIAQFS